MRSKTDSGRTFADEARRAQLVEVAIELIAQTGYPQTSLAKIADRAGIAKSVVLYHFKNKDELVAAIVTAVFTASAEVMVPAILAADDAPSRLAAYIDANGAFLLRHRQAAAALYEIATSYRSADGLRLDQLAQADVDAQGIPPEFALLDPQAIIESGIAAGEFTDSLQPSVVKDALRAALDGAVASMLRDPDFDVERYIATVKQIHLRALGAHK